MALNGRQALGRAAEDAAAALLRSQGVAILLRNYRCRIGELDIIGTLAPDLLLIVEVRARSRADYGGGAASVDATKRRHIVRTAQHLLMTHRELRSRRARFDVIEVQVRDGALLCNWIKAAFGC
ncbi:MAG: YraN family protein [Steroidobacteraceae bacterium]